MVSLSNHAGGCDTGQTPSFDKLRMTYMKDRDAVGRPLNSVVDLDTAGVQRHRQGGVVPGREDDVQDLLVAEMRC